MQKHILIALASGRSLHVARPTALDLDAAACLMLNMLDVSTAMAHNLGAKVETWHRLEADGNLLLGPFTLFDG